MPAVVSLTDTQPSIDNTPTSTPAAPVMASTPPAADPAPVAEPAKPEPVKLIAPKPVPTPSEMVQKKPEPKVESKPAPKPTPKSSGARSHTMAKGDTLYGLARKYGVSVSAIQKANNITKPESIRDGVKLIIPAK
jgi:LysM repeat protein